jgi:hypothetical protein
MKRIIFTVLLMMPVALFLDCLVVIAYGGNQTSTLKFLCFLSGCGLYLIGSIIYDKHLKTHHSYHGPGRANN